MAKTNRKQNIELQARITAREYKILRKFLLRVKTNKDTDSDIRLPMYNTLTELLDKFERIID